ncbi:hypothetical protein C8N36_1235 [Pelagimonas varians]|uniref:Uncharacterized protein n=1 Tax=Pelagimonas varians TaxID=696760 RepID=A0A238L6K1_9RHOB|nr:hypothetical protein C8N36_1235 [Pelagimonas varians]SMX50012.1 hypothetical protein PEV8663_04449 [Pelagimonas varians]
MIMLFHETHLRDAVVSLCRQADKQFVGHLLRVATHINF